MRDFSDYASVGFKVESFCRNVLLVGFGYYPLRAIKREGFSYRIASTFAEQTTLKPATKI